MKNLIYIILIASLTSCMTESKVSKYMRDNKKFSARECQVLFPIKETTDTSEVADSAYYFWAYNESVIALERLLDSIDSIKKRCNIKDPAPFINIDSLKGEIKRKLAPCVDKVITVTKTKVDTREVERLTILLDEQRARAEQYILKYESEKDKRIKAEDKLSDANKKIVTLYSLLIIVIILSLVIIFRKFIAPVASMGLTFISKLLKP